MDTGTNSNSFTQGISHTQLPAGNEIGHISDAEEKRLLLPERKNVHFPDFESIRQIYEYYHLDPEIFVLPNLEAEYILDIGGNQLDQLTKIILNKTLSEKETNLFTKAYLYLSEEDTLQPADYIYVFGAKTPLRIEKAIELFEKKLAPKIIVSGRGPFYNQNKNISEAEQYAVIARQSGVPEEALIIEPDSITIPDNVRRTLNMFDRQNISYRSFIIVNSPYSQRRGWCVWKKHTSDNIKIYRVNCQTGLKFSIEQWYKSEEGLKVILGEFIKLRNTIAFNDA